MGQSLSQDCISLGKTADAYGGEGQNVFEVGFDELSLATSFPSGLFSMTDEEAETKLAEPLPEMISNILNDFLTYSSASSVSEAFTKVIIPLFNSSPETKPRKVQIITSLFRFLRERSTPFFIYEGKRLRAEQERYDGIQADISNTHRKIPPPKYDVAQLISTPELFDDFCSNFEEKIKFEAISPHQKYMLVTEKLKEISNTEKGVYLLLKWGFAAGEITAIIDSFVGLTRLAISESEKGDQFDFKGLKTTIESISLANTCFAPPTNELISSTIPFNFSSLGMHQTSFITTNGTSLFILGKQKKLTLINLSKNITRHESRFEQINLDELEESPDNDMVITFSNDHLLIASQKVPMFSIYSTNPLKRIEEKVKFSIKGEFTLIPQCIPPFATDSKYFYSLNAPGGVAVFSISSSSKIVFHRFIDLIQSDSPLLDPYKSELFPAGFLGGLMSVTNGVTISFIKFQRSRNESCIYFARHFSLVDGKHISDSQFSLEYALSSITYDPWNRCYWGITSNESKHVIKIPSFNSQSPWLTGCDINYVSEFDINKPCLSHGQVSSGLLDFLEYYTVHFSGLLFHAAQSNQNYSPLIARFFAPCTNEAVDSIIQAINFFLDLYASQYEIGEWTIQRYSKCLLSLVRLLDYNLSNMDLSISAEDGEKTRKFEHQISAVKLLLTIIDNESLSFLHEPVVFTIVNSISLLFTGDYKNLPSIFGKIVKKMSPQFMLYTLLKVHNMPYYSYCFNSDTIPQYFSPIIEQYPNITSTQTELIDTYMRSLFMEIRSSLLSSQPSDLKPIIEASFFSFSDLILTNFSSRIVKIPSEYSEKTKESIPSISLFAKYFMMLHSLQQFPTIIEYAITKLREIFIIFSGKIQKMTFSAPVMPEHNLLFYSIFSSYIDYTGGLMMNTYQLQGSLQYSWLYGTTLESNLTPESVDELLKSSFENKSRRQMLRKGLSFNIHSVALNQNMQEDFLTSLVAEQECDSIQILLDYLYKRVPDQLKKPPTPDVRHVERFILAAYAKQLGFTADLCQLNLNVASDKTPDIPVFINQAIHSIYQIRRVLRMSKQSTAQYNSEFSSDKIENNYPEFLRFIMKKCVYLIHIQPCLRDMQDQESALPSMFKKLSSFIVSDMTLDSYYAQIVLAQKSRSLISRGVNYITEIITNNFSPLSPLFNCYVLEKFSTCEGIQTLVQYGINPSKRSQIPQEIDETLKMMNIVVDLATNLDDNLPTNSFYTFFSNTAFAVGQVYPQLIAEPAFKLIEYLATKPNSTSLEAMLVSMFWVLSQMSEDFAKSTLYKSLYQTLVTICNVPQNSIDSIQRFYRSGMDIIIYPSIVIDHLMECSPKYYSNYISVLGELCKSLTNKLPIFYWIMHEISSICSGGHSSFLNDYPAISETSLIDEEMCKTPDIVLGGCLDLIQLIRRFLNDSSSPTGRIIMDIFVLILNHASGKATNTTQEMEMFTDPLLLYGVFGVLSNVIDAVSFCSLIKDTTTSTLYFVSDIDQEKSQYLCWQLPITGDSILRFIPFGDNIISVPTTPFLPSTFPIYDAIIPVFLNFISLKNPSPFNEALSYFVFSSMREYCNELDFFNKLVDEQIYDVLPEFTFDNYNTDFMTVVRSHLASNTSGFNEPRSNASKFYYATPGILKETDGLVFTDSHFEAAIGLHVFMSSIFEVEKDITLTITTKKRDQNYDIGFYHLSINESNIKSLMYSRRDGKATISGKTRKILASNNIPKRRIELKYNSKTNQCSIYDPEKDTHLMTHIFPSPMMCFVVVLYPGSSLDYSLSNASKNDIELSGKIVFTQNRKKRLSPTLEGGITSTVTVNSDVKTLNLTSHPYKPLADVECNRFSAPRITKPFALYPDSIKPKDASLVTDKPARPPADKPQFLKYEIQATELIHFNPPPNSYYVLKGNSNELISTLLNPFNTVNVDSFTGEIKPANKAASFMTKDILPLIHPRNFSTLPTEVLNHFATGYARKLRKTLLSTILLQCYSPSSIGIEVALVKFNLGNQEALLKSLLSLLTTIEPFDLVSMSEGNCPMNFNLDLLDPNVMQPKSSQFLQKRAVTNIFDYLHKTDKLDSFLEIWFKHLINEFTDATSHSVKSNHPYAILIDPSSFSAHQTVSKQDAVQWIIMKTGFSNNDQEICQIIPTNQGKYYKLASKMILINSSSFSVNNLTSQPDDRIAAIPFMKDGSDSLSATFFDLIVSFKYFALTLSKEKSHISFTQIQKYRARVYCCFVDAFIASSPFFVTFGNTLLNFLHQTMPIMGTDFVGGVLTRFNFLSLYADRKKHSYLSPYLEELQALWDEKIFFNLKHYFPFFASESDVLELKMREKEPFQLPTTSQFPDSFDQKTPKQKLFITLKRILLPRDSQYGFPFPQLLVYWAKYSMLCPPTNIQRVNSKLLKVEFKEYLPHSVQMHCTQSSGLSLQYSFSPDITEPIEMRMGHAFELKGNNVVYFLLTDTTNVWELMNIYFISKDVISRPDFILEHSEWFVRDISQLLFQWDSTTDHTILRTFTYSTFTQTTLQVSINPAQLAISSLTQPLNILCLRAHFLLILNWFYGTTKDKFMQDPSIKNLLPLISPKLKLETFREIIRSKAHSRHPEIHIDRKTAAEIREGVSTNLNMSLIGQMVDVYKNVSDFRDDSDKPWEVFFANEPGIDAGGPARELVTELALDMCSVNCGLVVQSPNSRYEIGQYRDTVIPLPNPSISNINQRYRIFGAVIAIAIRTGLVQVFNFPPLVWEYLVTGDLTIDKIFEIDDNYKVLIQSLQEAQRSGMDDSTFKSRLNHKFVVTDARGNEMPLIQRGRQEQVTASNCAQFISLANEYRIKELTTSLKTIRDGMWENIGLPPIVSLDWQTLEYAACGEREITFEALRNVTSFEGIDKKQEDIFIKVIETLTSEQRSLLLRFTTGRIRLPPNITDNDHFLRVDATSGIDMMPTASTCFHQLHMPSYTSFEKALKLITIAIEYTGTMELR